MSGSVGGVCVRERKRPRVGPDSLHQFHHIGVQGVQVNDEIGGSDRRAERALLVERVPVVRQSL